MASRVQNRPWRVPGGPQAEALGLRRRKGINHREAHKRVECVCQDVDVNSSLSPALEYFKI